MPDVRDEIRHFILEHFLKGEAADNLKDDTPLQTSGILDSLATVTLVTFLQDRYGVEFTFDETSIERFDRIADIARTIEQKRTEHAEHGSR